MKSKDGDHNILRKVKLEVLMFKSQMACWLNYRIRQTFPSTFQTVQIRQCLRAWVFFFFLKGQIENIFAGHVVSVTTVAAQL